MYATFYNDCLTGGVTLSTNYPTNPWGITVAKQTEAWNLKGGGVAVAANGYKGMPAGPASFGYWLVDDGSNAKVNYPIPTNSSVNGTVKIGRAHV